MADLSAASLEDVSAFFRTYYAPNNASLCIAGDFDPAQTKQLVAKYFGPLPTGPEVKQPAPERPEAGRDSKHVTMTDQVSLPRAELVWPTVPRGHPDEPALDVLAAILGGLDKENRLFRALMYDRQLAAERRGRAPHAALCRATFNVALVRPAGPEARRAGQARRRRDRAAQDRGADRRRGAQGAEHASRAQLIVGLESIDQPGRLPQRVQRRVRRPARLQGRDAAGSSRSHPADVKRVANKYLTADRVRLDVDPRLADAPRARGRRSIDAAGAAQEPAGGRRSRTTFDRSVMPAVGPTPKFTPPPVVRRTALERPGGPDRRAARAADPDASTWWSRGARRSSRRGKEGLASMTAALLTEGTTIARRAGAGRRPGRRSAPRSTPAAGCEASIAGADDADQAHRRGRWSCTPTCCCTRRSPRRS